MTNVIARELLILGKAEASYGVDPTLAVANAVLVHNPELTPLAGGTVDRELVKPYFGASQPLQTGVHATLAFGVECTGVQPDAANKPPANALPAPAIEPFLLACGMAVATDKLDNADGNAATRRTYKPITGAEPSVAFNWNVDGQGHSLLGCRGSWQLELPSAGIPRWRFAFSGRYAQPGSVAQLASPVYAGYKRPDVLTNENADLSVFGNGTFGVHTLSLDYGAGVEFDEIVGLSDEILITGRSMTGSLRLRSQPLSVVNWFAKAKASETGAIVYELGWGDKTEANTHADNRGRMVTITLPKAAISNPRYGEERGLQTTELDIAALPTDGNDEVSIAFH